MSPGVRVCTTFGFHAERLPRPVDIYSTCSYGLTAEPAHPCARCPGRCGVSAARAGWAAPRTVPPPSVRPPSFPLSSARATHPACVGCCCYSTRVAPPSKTNNTERHGNGHVDKQTNTKFECITRMPKGCMHSPTTHTFYFHCNWFVRFGLASKLHTTARERERARQRDRT